MNVNPHLQYIQQQQLLQQQGQSSMNAGLQSPLISQIHPQQQQLQLQQQRQQILNHQFQQQQPQQIGVPGSTHINPILASINGSNANNRAAAAASQVVNPPMQVQLQHQQQQQQQAQPLQPLQQFQAPLIKEVWAHNLEQEFQNLRAVIRDNDSDVYVALHQEIPGIVARPVGTFKSPSDYHFQTLRSNSDLLNIIQLSLCITKIGKNKEQSASFIWQFNFLYDLSKEMYNEEHLAMLSQSAQINFQLTMTQGISHFKFAELLIESGLLLDTSVNWITYHAGYDLGFLVSILLNRSLPADEKDFLWWCSKYFPNFFDLKLLGEELLSSGGSSDINGNKSLSSHNQINVGSMSTNSQEMPNNVPNSNENVKNSASGNKPSIEFLAEDLHLLPILPPLRQYFASSNSHFPGQQALLMTSSLHSYLTVECFRELFRLLGFDKARLDRFKGSIWGLGNLNNSNAFGVNSHRMNSASPPTPINSMKGGVVHLGRIL